MAYNKDRKGWETKDGGLIRVNGSGDKVRIDVYEGNERTSGGHSRDSIHYDTTSGKGKIDSHNADKSTKSSTDTSCYLTTACMKQFLNEFNDNCYELTVLRWFRDNYVSKEDIEHYYRTAPKIVEAINNIPNNEIIYDYIYDNIVDACVSAIENGDYQFAYNRYKNSIVSLEENFLESSYSKRLIRV